MPLLLFFIRNEGKQLLIRIKSPNYWKMKNKTTAFLSSATFLLFSLFCMCIAVRDARSFGYHIRWQYHWFDIRFVILTVDYMIHEWIWMSSRLIWRVGKYFAHRADDSHCWHRRRSTDGDVTRKAVSKQYNDTFIIYH